jgi:hypothetical protein
MYSVWKIALFLYAVACIWSTVLSVTLHLKLYVVGVEKD